MERIIVDSREIPKGKAVKFLEGEFSPEAQLGKRLSEFLIQLVKWGNDIRRKTNGQPDGGET